MTTYRDRDRRETLAKLSKGARALHDDLARWLAAEEEGTAPGPVPALRLGSDSQHARSNLEHPGH